MFSVVLPSAAVCSAHWQPTWQAARRAKAARMAKTWDPARDSGTNTPEKYGVGVPIPGGTAR